MAARSQAFALALAPGGAEMAAVSVAPMLMAMASRAGEELEHKARMAIFIEDLRDLPAWAVAEACARFRRGEIGGGTFAPTPGEVRQEVCRLVARVAKWRRDIDAVLRARVVPDTSAGDADTRKAIAARVLAESRLHAVPAPPPLASIDDMPRRGPVTVGHGLKKFFEGMAAGNAQRVLKEPDAAP